MLLTMLASPFSVSVPKNNSVSFSVRDLQEGEYVFSQFTEGKGSQRWWSDFCLYLN